MPLAFVASAGSLLALTGSPVNVIVSEAAANTGEHGFGYLAFASVGIPLVVGTIALALLLGRRVVPARHARCRWARAPNALAVLIGMVALLATGAVPAFVASMLGACAMVVLRVLSVDEAYRAVSWTTVILIGAMIAVWLPIRRSLEARSVPAGPLLRGGDFPGPGVLVLLSDVGASR